MPEGNGDVAREITVRVGWHKASLGVTSRLLQHIQPIRKGPFQLQINCNTGSMPHVARSFLFDLYIGFYWEIMTYKRLIVNGIVYS